MPNSWEGALLEHLAPIERFAERLARGSGFRPAEVEDFVGSVRLKLVDDDYAVLRKHRGESSLRGYLKMVVSNHLRDERNRRLGKYRPSVRATRGGPDAVQLDRFVRRDGFDTETAIRMVRERHPQGSSVEQLRQLAEALPEHHSRRFVSDEVLAERAEAGDAEERAERGERADVHRRVETTLAKALAALSDQDQVILKMIFKHGLPISKVARLVQIRQRALYTRRDRCLRTIRRALDDAGLTTADVRGILGWDLEIDWGNDESSPSPDGEEGVETSDRSDPEGVS
ncbi:MAG: sigma-70 family RNA polymerase sigma factor [Acidobacteriota bacterium]